MAKTVYKIVESVRRGAGTTVLHSTSGTSALVDFTSMLANYYTKNELQTSGSALVHFDNITEAYHNNLLDLQGGLDSSSGDSSGSDAEYYHLDLSTYLDVTGISFVGSLEKDSINAVSLIGDLDSPGNSKYYGTDDGGVKGWFDLPSGGGGGSLWEEISGGFITPAESTGVGVLVGNIYIDSSTIYTVDGSKPNITVQAGDAMGVAGTDAGHLILKAGDAINADSNSSPGNIYLVPGVPPTSQVATIYLGQDALSSLVAGIMLKPAGQASSIGLTLASTGGGGINIGQQTAPPTSINLYSSVLQFAAVNYVNINGAAGSSGSTAGKPLRISAGNGYGIGDSNGGNLYLYGGTGYGSGVRGDVYLGSGSAGYLPESDSSDVIYVVTYNPDTGKLGYTQLI